MYLLDTKVVSERRKPRPHGAVVAWVRKIDARELYLSAMVIGELQRGIELTRRQDQEKAIQLEYWVSQIVATYQVLPLDAEVCREWARLMQRRSKALTEDALIAATAKVHGFSRGTRVTLPGGISMSSTPLRSRVRG